MAGGAVEVVRIVDLVGEAELDAERPSIDATERSISPVITINVSGSAMMAISPMFSPMKNTSVDVRKCGDSEAPNKMLPSNTKLTHCVRNATM